MRRTNGVSADGKESFQRLTVSSVWIELHVALRERVELTDRDVKAKLSELGKVILLEQEGPMRSYFLYDRPSLR